MYYHRRIEKEEEEKRKVFSLLRFFFLFVSAYNHLSALCVDEGEGEKEKNECNSIVKLSAA
jgi:hypothetical protein